MSGRRTILWGVCAAGWFLATVGLAHAQDSGVTPETAGVTDRIE
jgi:hypothetical protein